VAQAPDAAARGASHVEWIDQAFNGQLERNTVADIPLEGVAVRMMQRVLALTAGMRSLVSYDQ
jgi:hypothetical protein